MDCHLSGTRSEGILLCSNSWAHRKYTLFRKYRLLVRSSKTRLELERVSSLLLTALQG